MVFSFQKGEIILKNEIETKKFYTCKYDRPFKEIFLNEKNKHLLKGLLETILKVKIDDIEIRPTEKNMPLKEIMEITSLTQEEIEKL